MLRITAGAGPYVLTQTWYVDGTATDVGTVTIGVVDGNGDSIVAAGTATTNAGSGIYTYTLASQSTVNLLVVTWTRSDTSAGLSSYIEVVGSHLFTEAAARAYGDAMLSTANVNPSDADVAAARDRITEFLEHETQRSWIRRYNRVEVPGTGNHELSVRDGYSRTSTGLVLHRPGAGRDINRVLTATADGTTVSTGNIKVVSDGRLIRTDGNWPTPSSTNPNNIVIEYEYGLPQPVDGSDRIAMMLARHQLVASRHPENALSFNDPLATYQFDPSRMPSEAYQWIKNHRVGVFFG